MNLGPTELIIILAIVLLVFGVGRMGKIGGCVELVARWEKDSI